MAEFNYRGVDRSGKKVQGKISASSEGEVRVLLRGQGVRPTSMSKVSVGQQDIFAMFKGGGIGTISHEDLMLFTRQLQVMLGSGVPLVQALELLGEQSPSGNLRNMCIALKQKVSEGAFFWETLNGFPKSFPKLYTSLVRAGETSGSLEVMLKRLAGYLEDSFKMQKMIKSMMAYPGIMATVAAGVMLLMLKFVIPKFEEMLKASKQELPVPTAMVIQLSKFVGNQWYFILGGLIAGFFVIRSMVQTEEGRRVIDQMSLRLPMLGGVVKKATTARFCRTLATLLSSGVTLLDALEICKSTVGNSVVEDVIAKAKPEVETGKTLSSALIKSSVFPPMAVQMLSVGENTGQVDRMLEKVADYYDAEVEIAIQGVSKLIEPIMIVFLGGMIGGLLIAMYLPIFQMAGGG